MAGQPKKTGSLIRRMDCRNAAVKSLSASVRKSYKMPEDSLTNWRLMAAISAAGLRPLSMILIRMDMIRVRKYFSPCPERYSRIYALAAGS